VVHADYFQKEDHSAVDGAVRELKILMYATNGEKDFLKDNSVIFMPYG
jgi:hypothetical protein